MSKKSSRGRLSFGWWVNGTRVVGLVPGKFALLSYRRHRKHLPQSHSFFCVFNMTPRKRCIRINECIPSLFYRNRKQSRCAWDGDSFRSVRHLCVRGSLSPDFLLPSSSRREGSWRAEICAIFLPLHIWRNHQGILLHSSENHTCMCKSGPGLGWKLRARETPNARVRTGDFTTTVPSLYAGRQCIICSAENWMTQQSLFSSSAGNAGAPWGHFAALSPSLGVFVHAEKGESCRTIITWAESEPEL